MNIYASDVFLVSFNSAKITEIVLSSSLMFLILLAISIKAKRLSVYIINSILLSGFIISNVYSLNILTLTILGISFFINLSFSKIFISDYSKLFQLKKNSKNKKKKMNDSQVKKEKLLDDLQKAVMWLSKNKVGALITFEREVSLDNFIKSGTIINCPFTAEIVETIFYEGTRLHDGAIVIRDDIIIAAAVYYQPTKRAVVGKFGARHRAALGISEVSDSITVIVSEETGRISIAHSGLLDNVKIDEFRKMISKLLM